MYAGLYRKIYVHHFHKTTQKANILPLFTDEKTSVQKVKELELISCPKKLIDADSIFIESCFSHLQNGSVLRGQGIQ
jgi:hypothetical protein